MATLTDSKPKVKDKKAPLSSGATSGAHKIAKDKAPLPLDVEMARQDALRVCNPDISRPFASLEDACERLLPFHVLADYDLDDRLVDGSGQLLSRSQMWNENLTTKVMEFKSTMEKQIEAFNSIMKKRVEGDFRTEERLKIEQLLLQDEKQKLIDIKIEIETRERAEREAEARMKEVVAQAERARAEAQAQAEAQARAEAARMQAQAEAARMQAHAEAARMQAHAEVARIQARVEAVRHAHAEAARMQAHAEAAQMQAQANAEALHFVRSQMQSEDNTGLEANVGEQDGMVEEMLDSWEPLEEDASDTNPEDLFTEAVHDQAGVDRGFHDMDLLTTNAMQGDWKDGGTLDLNTLNSR